MLFKEGEKRNGAVKIQFLLDENAPVIFVHRTFYESKSEPPKRNICPICGEPLVSDLHESRYETLFPAEVHTALQEAKEQSNGC